MRRRPKRGYALVMTVLLIAIAGLSLAGFARLSILKASQSLQASHHLQRRWGVASCERLIFGGVDDLLTKRHWNEELSRWDMDAKPVMTANLVLGGQRFEMLISDESAKFDLNFMTANLNAAQWLDALDSVAVSQSLPLNLQPLAEPSRRDVKEGAFESWDQVLATDANTSPLVIMAASTTLTCWSARLNFHSASDAALKETCRILVGDGTAARIVDARAGSEGQPLDAFLTSLALTSRQQRRLAQGLTDKSASQSVWTRVSGNRSDRYFLTVREGVADSVFRYQTFQW